MAEGYGGEILDSHNSQPPSLRPHMWGGGDGLLCAIFLAFLSVYLSTVMTLNSCTKCVGSTGRIHDCTPDCHPVSRAWLTWMTSQLNAALMC